MAFLRVLEEVFVDEKAQKRTGVFDLLPSAGVVFTSQLYLLVNCSHMTA